MHTFKLLLFVLLTSNSSAIFAAQNEHSQNAAETNMPSTQPKFAIANKTPKQSRLRERMADLNIPAVSIALMENHIISLTLTEGVIDFESQQEIDKNTVFQTSSIAKPVLAPVLLKFRQERGVNADTEVNTLLKSSPLPLHKCSTFTPVTLRRLLSHSSGISVLGSSAYAAGTVVPTIIDVLKGASSENPMATLLGIGASTRPWYSGCPITSAQLDLHDQFTMPLPELAKTLILYPLNTEHNAYSQALSEPLANNSAVPHLDVGLRVQERAYTSEPAGLWTTPSNLLKLASTIQTSYQDLDKSLNISKTVTPMLATQIESMDIGIVLDKQDGPVASFSDGGANEGFSANLFFNEQTGNGIAIMTNSNNGGKLVNDILSRISEVYGWNEFSQMEKNETVIKPELTQVVIDEDKLRKPMQSKPMQSKPMQSKPMQSKPMQSISVLVAEGEQF